MGFSECLRDTAAHDPARPALRGTAGWRDYAAVDRRVDALARWLTGLGVTHGERVAVLLPDGTAFIEVLLASARIGAIAVLLNWRLATPEIAWILGDCEPRVLLCADQFADLAPRDPPFVVAGDAAIETAVETVGPPVADAAAPADAMHMIYTSGTTGKPKGCVHSHATALGAARGFAERRAVDAATRLFSTSPLFHVAGLQHLLAVLACGGAVVVPERGLSPADMLGLMADERCNLAWIVPTLLVPMRRAAQAAGRTITLARMTASAGASDPARMAWLGRDWGSTVTGGYGQTEAGGWATFIDLPQMLERPTSIGLPLPHLAMTVLDADGAELPPETEGEIAVRGASVMTHYWRNPAATAAAFTNGWLRTGDLGKRDAQGYFFMLGRAKELIKTGGENVYPAELDDLLKQLPEVADAAVAGVPDRQWGEAVKAFIVPRPGAVIDPARILAHCRAHLAGYKRPRYLEVLDALPYDPLGKLRRRELSARPVDESQRIA